MLPFFNVKMVNIIIVRHAKTNWNHEGRIQGRSDIPLTAESILMAKEASAGLRGLKIDRVYTSPLIRARQTAEAITEGLGLDIESDDRIIERDFGELDGRKYDELGFENHDKLFLSLAGIKGAEQAETVFSRAKDFLEFLKREHDGETILVVSHGAFTSFLLYAKDHDEYNEDNYTIQYIKNLTMYKTTYGE